MTEIETKSNIPASESIPQPTKPRGWKRGLKSLTLRVLFWYVVICVVVMCLQRKLMYHPSRAENLPISAALAPAGSVQEIAFDTEDGLTLKGWHFLRTGFTCNSPTECQNVLDEGGLLVLYFHGNAGDRRQRVEPSQILNGLGADVFVMDYRGYGENPGSPSEEGLAADARALWKYATEDRGVSPDRIVLFGVSLGGGVAVRLAHELEAQGTPPGGMILLSTFSSMADAAGEHYPWLPVGWLLWDRYPSADLIDEVTCPLLFLHGTQDRIVSHSLGRKLFEASPEKSANGLPKCFVDLDQADHNDIFTNHRPQFYRAAREFFTELSPPQKTGSAARSAEE